jgi:hypothetical protein
MCDVLAWMAVYDETATLLCVQGRDGKVVQVYRKRWVIHIERLAREKVNGADCVPSECSMHQGLHQSFFKQSCTLRAQAIVPSHCISPGCHPCAQFGHFTEGPMPPECNSSAAGATVQVGIDPSKVVVTKLRLDKDRKSLLARKKGAKGKDGNKFNEADVDTMENID